MPDSSPLLEVVGEDLAVPLVTGDWVRFANLDIAASAPALRAVVNRLDEVLPYYASVHRGAGYLSQVSTGLYEQAREVVRRFVGARAEDLAVFTRHTTDALNLLASCVPDGGEVVTLDVEHHANLLPWRAGRWRIVEAAPTWAATLEALEEQIAGERTALLAITGASNVTGEVPPLEDVVALARRHGVRLAVDAAQLAPHRPVHMEALGIDYVALSGHKLYAPFGCGALIGRSDWLDAADPHLAGGGAVERVTRDAVRWTVGAERHEAGTPNVLGAVALATACETLTEVPADAVSEHEIRLRDELVQGLEKIDAVEVVQMWPDLDDGIGMATFAARGLPADLLAAALSAEHGIGLRDGRFCAHPLLERLGLPAGAVRASLGVGSRTEDVTRLIAAVGTIVADGPAWTYERIQGRPEPLPDPRSPGPVAMPAMVRSACQN